MHEAQQNENNCFLTLTYDDEHARPSLNYTDFQKFMKRTRRRFSPARARFYVGGEYGEQYGRPHFHACVFGIDFKDKTYWSKSPSGERLYRSQTLEELWPFGFSSIGNITFQSAAYVARYVMKKVTGTLAAKHYERIDPTTGEIFTLTPEFNHMSLKPGIGANWLSTFEKDVYPHAKVIVNAKEVNPPRYYEKLYLDKYPNRKAELAELKEAEAYRHRFDNTWQRLEVKERVARAKIKQLKRTL